MGPIDFFCVATVFEELAFFVSPQGGGQIADPGNSLNLVLIRVHMTSHFPKNPLWTCDHPSPKPPFAHRTYERTVRLSEV